MKWKMINTPLGLSQPYGVSRKSNAAAAIADGLLGGLFTLGATQIANESSERNTKRTNEANKEINEQQIAYAREQYEKERLENRFLVDQAYQRSSPAAQKARYLAAGINPYLAMSGSGGSLGSAGVSVGSPARGNQPNAISMQSPEVFVPKGFEHGLGLLDSAQYALAAERQEADISAIKQKIQQDWLETFSKINSRNWSNKKIQQEVNELILKNAFTKQTWDESARNVHLINDKLFADIQYQEAMTNFQNIVNEFEPSAREKTLKNLEANYDKIMSEVYANNEDGAYKEALASITGVDEQIKRDCADAVVDECYNKANEAYYRSQQSAKNLGEGEVIGRSLPAQTYDGSYRQYGDNDRKYVRSSVSRSAKKRVILK